MTGLKFEVVAMKDVPDPPVGSRTSKYWDLYLEIKKLGLAQAQALRVEVKGRKELNYLRTQISALARKDGRRLLTSRNQASTVGFFWLIKQDQAR